MKNIEKNEIFEMVYQKLCRFDLKMTFKQPWILNHNTDTKYSPFQLSDDTHNFVLA